MKLIVVGPIGRIGRHLADQALLQGDQIIASVRNPKESDQPDEDLRVVNGNAMGPGSVKSAIQGHDGVILALGMPIVNTDKLRAHALDLPGLFY